MYRLLYTEEAKKQIAKLGERTKVKAKEALELISENPAIGKALTRELKGRWSYRVGSYRILYRIHRTDVLVFVLAVGHRREIYFKSARKEW